MNIQPFYVIPILIRQPTWGGDYIVKAKNLNHGQLQNEKIGQSYELSAESRISAESAAQDAVYLTDSELGAGQQFGAVTSTFDLQSLVNSNPEAILGPLPPELAGLSLLVKFTQASSNSYQVHVKPGNEFHGWQSKPESWYYLEPGRATLGLKPGAEIAQYKRLCEEIEAIARQLSEQVKNEQTGINSAREQLNAFLAENHPSRFVNALQIPKDSVVNLSSGGIHHSWESDPTLQDGNIVYEVQVDVKDGRSTIRAFDQGSLKDSGVARPLHIQDYFQAINTSPVDNQPESLITQPQGTTINGIKVSALFDTPYYKLHRYEMNGPGSIPMKTNSYHHVYALRGDLRIEWKDLTLDLREGRSLFIPAICGDYLLSSADSATTLITTPI